MSNILSKQITLLWKFLGFFQPPFIRILHAVIASCIIINLAIGFTLASIDDKTTLFFKSIGWIHISFGIIITLLTIIFIPACFYHRRGIKYFFPYLWGDTSQLIKDIKASLAFKLIPPTSEGLAAVIQGLGLGALLLTVLTGITWLVCWQKGLSYASFFKGSHQIFAILLGIYLLGHGTMAVIHFIVWKKKVVRSKSDSLHTN